jgi:hypothetical protein
MRRFALCSILCGIACGVPATATPKANTHWPLVPPVRLTAYRTLLPGDAETTRFQVEDDGAHPCGSVLEDSVTFRDRMVTISLSARPVVYEAPAPGAGCPAVVGIEVIKSLQIPPGIYGLILQTSVGTRRFRLSIPTDTLVQPDLVETPGQAAPQAQ